MVLTNTSAGMMHLTVACRVLDELLGVEPVDVSGYGAVTRLVAQPLGIFLPKDAR